LFETNQRKLTKSQARVFACLVEKHLSTPKNYPLSINSLMLACNQKSNRYPVMSLDEGQVEHIAKELVDLDLARIDYGVRTKKVMHKAMGEFKINREEAAILCMLILREPLTLNDIKARTAKMVAFADVAAVNELVNKLMSRDEPLVVLLPRASGQREERYTHTLCGEVDVSKVISKSINKPAKLDKRNNPDLSQKIFELEERLAIVEKTLNELIN